MTGCRAGPNKRDSGAGAGARRVAATTVFFFEILAFEKLTFPSQMFSCPPTISASS
jgi:hypothetical protein